MIRFFRPFLVTLVLALLWSGGPSYAQIQEVGDGGPGPVKAQHLTAELVSLAPAVSPGGNTTVGLVLTMEEHWHVYWVNAGDSGEPPVVKWTAPQGATLGPMQYPVPSQLPLGPLMDFGYEDTAAFPFALNIASSAGPVPSTSTPGSTGSSAARSASPARPTSASTSTSPPAPPPASP